MSVDSMSVVGAANAVASPARGLAAGLRAAITVSAAVAVIGVVVAVGWAPGVLTVSSALLALASVSVAIVGAAMVRATPRNGAAWILLASGLGLPVAETAYIWSQAVFVHRAALPGGELAGWLDGWPWVPSLGLLPTVGLLLFPDGRLPGRRWRPVLYVGIGVAALLTLGLLLGPDLLDYPQRRNPTALPGAAGTVAGAAFAVILLVAPLSTLGALAVHRRARRASADGDRAAAAALALLRPAGWAIAASWWSCVLVTALGGSSAAITPVEEIGLLALAVTGWVAIRRLGLVDARLVLNRALVYGALSAAVLGAYLLVGALLSTLASTAVSGPVAVLAALAVALPLRTALQRGANSLVYGARDDPVAALDVLGRRLEGAAEPAEVLPAAARAVRDALRVPYVAVEVGGRIVAVAGSLTPGAPVDGAPGNGAPEHGQLAHGQPAEFALVFAREPIGRLLVATRTGSSGFTGAERMLLVGVGRQIAAAAHAVSLFSDLLRSRERLVAAAEEERRRLRRDLHDGLGPALAGVVLGIARARRLVAPDPAAAETQLDSVRAQTQSAVAEIRRLVDGLRPPALDELGLVGALREQADAFGIAIEGPDGAGTLPAAVEVAAYRIAVEAMTNTVRHARATRASVTVAVDTALHLDVVDDGVGLPAVHRAGVGMTSMRERAAELGGTCTIDRREPSGTRVRAVIPLVRP